MIYTVCDTAKAEGTALEEHTSEMAATEALGEIINAEAKRMHALLGIDMEHALMIAGDRFVIRHTVEPGVSWGEPDDTH